MKVRDVTRSLLSCRNRGNTHFLRGIPSEGDLRAALAVRGFAAVRARHTCCHRADDRLATVARPAGRAPA